MSLIRISLPLWKKRLDEQGTQSGPLAADIPQETIEMSWTDLPPEGRRVWPRYKRNFWLDNVYIQTQSPLPADVIPPSDNEWKIFTDLPPIGKKNNKKYEYRGFQFYVTPDDIPQETVEQFTDLPVAPRKFNKKFEYSGWNQTPLSSDIPQGTINLQADELYPFAKKLNRKYDYRGIQQSPLASDIPQETIHLQHTDIPPVGKKFILKALGWTQTPLADDIPQETIHIQEYINPQLKKRNLSKHIDWQQQPLSPNEPMEAIHTVETPDRNPYRKNRNNYNGWLQEPLSASFVPQIAAFMLDMPEYPDEFHYPVDEFSGVGPDTVMSAHTQEFPTQLFTRYRRRIKQQDWLSSPLSTAQEEDIINRFWFEVPKGKNRREVTHWEQSPLVADIPQETIQQWDDLPVIKQRKNKYSFDGWIQTPRPVEYDVPQPTIDLAPFARNRVSYEGWQQVPYTVVAAEEPLHAAAFYDVPIGHSKAYRLSWMPSQSQATVPPDVTGGHKPRLTILGCGH